MAYLDTIKRTLILVLLGTLIAVSRTNLVSALYSSDTYGGCSYGQDCPTSTTPAESTTTTSEVETPAEGEIILLNNFPEYGTTIGKQLSLINGQRVYFDVLTGADKSRFSVLVGEVGVDYVNISLTSALSNQKIMVGQTKEYDVNGDGKNDITITLRSINGKSAVVGFSSLVSTAKKLTTPTPAVAKKDASYIILYALIAIVGIGLSWWLLLKRHRSRNNPST